MGRIGDPWHYLDADHHEVMKMLLVTLAFAALAAGCWWLLFNHNSGFFNSTFVTIAIFLPVLALLIKKKSN